MRLSKRRKSRVRAWEVLVIAVSLILLAAAVLLILQDRRDRNNLEVLEGRLRRIRRLGTVRQTYRSVIYFEERNFWRGGKMVLFTVEHNIAAGVDLSEGLVLQKRMDGSVEALLPAAQIFSVDADESSIHQMLLREGLFNNPVRIGDYMPRVIAQGNVIREAALNEGILHLAERNARSAVARVLGLGGISQVHFTTEAAPAPQAAPAPKPPSEPLSETPND